MRTSSVVLLTLLAVFTLTASVGAQATTKVAYVDTQKLLVEAPGAQEARQTLEQDLAGYEAELKELEDELTRMITEFEQQQVMLAPETRRQREQAIRDKQQAYQRRAMELEDTYNRRQAELLDPVMQRLSLVIEEIRKEQGYGLVVDSAALLAADPELDITDKILERLRNSVDGGF